MQREHTARKPKHKWTDNTELATERIRAKGTELESTIPGYCGPGSSVGIATYYGLDGPGIESRWGRDFLHLSRPTLEPTQPPVQWVLGFSWG
jgi:hypothetical protein